MEYDKQPYSIFKKPSLIYLFIIYPISLFLFTDEPYKVLLIYSFFLFDPVSSPHILSLTQIGLQSPLFQPDCLSSYRIKLFANLGNVSVILKVFFLARGK